MDHAPGCLLAVVGPSGAGKDTILSAVAGYVADAPDILFVRRAITRNEGMGEDNLAVTPEAFHAAQRSGAFCLSWRAHGLFYGLPASALVHVQQGGIAIANLSRRALAPAATIFPRLAIIEITAPPHILHDRLMARGRESGRDVDARLARDVPLHVPPSAGTPVRIDNSGTLSASVARFLETLAALRSRALA